VSFSQIEIQLIAIITAMACALPGAFLVLQRKTMLSDAISHTVLLGIVLAFFIVRDLSSPILILGAALVGVLTVSLVAIIERTRLVKEDTAIGLVFTTLFSIAIILISLFTGDIHLDVDAVLVGEVAFAPFDRFTPFGIDIGPRGLYVMGGIFLINLVFIFVFYKELKLTTFDGVLAASLGFAPALLHYALMGLVSVTVVGAFDVVGSVLVVALIVVPPATAYLITDRLDRMLLYSAGIGAISAVGGYWLAYALDVSISGSMVVVSGLLFSMVFIFAPERGLLSGYQTQRRQKITFALTMLAAHLFNHENTPEEYIENNVSSLSQHLRWPNQFAYKILREALRSGVVTQSEDLLMLTDRGRVLANQKYIQS
jgi:manganese/zinc/iron transport system permease protein